MIKGGTNLSVFSPAVPKIKPFSNDFFITSLADISFGKSTPTISPKPLTGYPKTFRLSFKYSPTLLTLSKNPSDKTSSNTTFAATVDR